MNRQYSVCLAVVLLGSACLPLDVSDGLLCDTGKRCPDGMSCASDGVCYKFPPICEVPGSHEQIADALADERCVTIALLAEEHVESVRVGRDVTIFASGTRWLGDGFGPILTIDAGTVTVRDLVIADGEAEQGGAVKNAGTLTLDNCTITSSSADEGGGIYNSGTLTVLDGTISQNVASLAGAGLYSVGTLDVRRTEIVDNVISVVNSSAGGGGVYSGAGAVRFEATTISQNSVIVAGANPTALGAGMWLRGGPITILDSDVSSNQVTAVASAGNAMARGGALYVELESGTQELGLLGSTITANLAQIENSGGSVRGGAIAFASSGTATLHALIQESEISLNETRGNNLDQAHVVDLDGTIQATAEDGSMVSLTVKRSTIADNRVEGTPQALEQPTVLARGGGLGGASTDFGASVRFLLENSTFSLNQVGHTGLTGASGAGLDLRSQTAGAAVVLETRNVTVWDNVLLGGSGAAGVQVTVQNAADLTGQARNSIFAGSTGGDDCAVSGDLWTGHYDWIDVGAAGCFDGTSTHLSSGDPVIGALAQNGGPTRTHLPQVGSPVLEAGNPAGCTTLASAALTVDQRNLGRPFGAECDLGAVERGP